jgi:hypothetical protein
MHGQVFSLVKSDVGACESHIMELLMRPKECLLEKINCSVNCPPYSDILELWILETIPISMYPDMYVIHKVPMQHQII